jgi:2-polyprenyl-3-methyl-5-hydroxy-6-metoxy-1,4-benzoquinol methylase
VTDTPPVPSGAWFNSIARHVGPAYLRNSFTKGTEQEVGFLVDALGLEAGVRVLDVGCGPGRHALALARRGIDVIGVDVSEDFVALARDAATAEELPARFEVGDVRDLAYHAEYDAVICLCQGGFGLLGGRDEPRAF